MGKIAIVEFFKEDLLYLCSSDAIFCGLSYILFPFLTENQDFRFIPTHQWGIDGMSGFDVCDLFTEIVLRATVLWICGFFVKNFLWIPEICKCAIF